MKCMFLYGHLDGQTRDVNCKNGHMPRRINTVKRNLPLARITDIDAPLPPDESELIVYEAVEFRENEKKYTFYRETTSSHCSCMDKLLELANRGA